jgi:hypothetical protein
MLRTVPAFFALHDGPSASTTAISLSLCKKNKKNTRYMLPSGWIRHIDIRRLYTVCRRNRVRSLLPREQHGLVGLALGSVLAKECKVHNLLPEPRHSNSGQDLENQPKPAILFGKKERGTLAVRVVPQRREAQLVTLVDLFPLAAHQTRDEGVATVLVGAELKRVTARDGDSGALLEEVGPCCATRASG